MVKKQKSQKHLPCCFYLGVIGILFLSISLVFAPLSQADTAGPRSRLMSRLETLEKQMKDAQTEQEKMLTAQANTIETIKGLKIWVSRR
ncbi:MAG: hypothetical protein COV74_05670 [Candidatus Omnitrophica bacterium CG11_big_fil_rev_8_21_14_0_20_45_26]|uniref:Uncharacterized protein n=1 Tax=Candidatus Abzuiibacterium crystallinum TaxID=1974748 RepID=A0A2H0LP51_9BACT|nr:MAG: hypothetical protein COV74_05670 [Candidatus Omnitrophica bacterium CG11_big_fil_rev_8_21_14_0_20_45_26]PIW65263.1 MAG: hypothetical protein COW12_02690 [Candidatus Omnitrophica bacterium CG12_big_fil_rev_8_21_14_0_65_45_16]